MSKNTLKDKVDNIPSGEITLLGNIDIAGTALKLKKGVALVAYLAVEGQCSRRHLAELLWPNNTRADARRNLRWLLSKLYVSHPELIVANRDSLLLCNGLTIDCQRVKALLMKPGIQSYRQAVSLHQGEFLSTFDGSDISLEFSEWLETTRRYFFELKQEGLNLWAARALEAQDFNQLLRASEALLYDDPYNEFALRNVLTACQSTGRGYEIRGRLERFTRHLKRELGLNLSQETLNFIASLKQSSQAAHMGFSRNIARDIDNLAVHEPVLMSLQQILRGHRLVTIAVAREEGRAHLSLEFDYSNLDIHQLNKSPS